MKITLKFEHPYELIDLLEKLASKSINPISVIPEVKFKEVPTKELFALADTVLSLTPNNNNNIPWLLRKMSLETQNLVRKYNA